MRGLSSNILSGSRADSTRSMKYIADTNSLGFDGNVDGLVVTDDNDLSPTDGANNDKPFSISVWIKNHQSGDGTLTQASLWTKAIPDYMTDGSISREYKLFIHAGKLFFDIHDNYEATYKRVTDAGTETITNPHNEWYHIVATYDGSENSTGMKLYRNGLPLSLSTGSGGSFAGIANTVADVYIGARADANTYDLDGEMSQLIYWNDYELSQAEVDQIYNDGTKAVDPTVNTGDYQGASYCKCWLKMDGVYEITAASTSYSYAVTEVGRCGGDLINEEEHAEEYIGNCAELDGIGEEGLGCCKQSTVTPAVNGILDSSGNGNHARYNTGLAAHGNPFTTAALSTNVSDEYTNNF